MTTKTIGPYELQQKIGSHSRHHVYRAIRSETGAEVALKIVRMPSKVKHESAKKKIEFEARLLKRLNHPNLVKILDAGVEDQNAYFVMEPTDGESLSSLMSRRGKLAWDLAVDYAKQIAAALEYIHSLELVHLKMTPEKILIESGGKVKIADLRVNRAKKRRWDVSRQNEVDVAAYMSPEQLDGSGGTAKSDLYALGVVLFEMLTGKLPHEPDTLPRLLKRKQHLAAPKVSLFSVDCPIWLERLVARLLAADPLERPHSAEAVIHALNEVQKIDAQGTGVAEHLAGGFNALTAGQDKSEAKRVLGRKEPRPEIDPALKNMIWLSAALGATMALSVFGIWYAVTPPSEEKLYAQAKAMIDQGDSRSLKIAHSRYVEPLVKHYPNGVHADEVQEWVDLIEMDYARNKMIRRHNLGQQARSAAESLFLQGYQIEQFGDNLKALEIYQQVVDTVDKEGEQRAYHLMAAKKVDELSNLVGSEDWLNEFLQDKLDQAERYEQDLKPVEARRIWKQIVDRYDGNPDAARYVAQARERLGISEDSEQPTTQPREQAADPEQASEPGPAPTGK